MFDRKTTRKSATVLLNALVPGALLGALLLGAAGPAWAISCPQTLTRMDLVLMAMSSDDPLYVVVDGERIDISVPPPDGKAEGSYVLLRSPSDTYHLEWVPTVDELRFVSLYRGDTLVSSWRQPFRRPSYEFLLDDGTYVAIENPGCGGPQLQQTIIAVSSTGERLWTRNPETLLPDHYLHQLTQSRGRVPPIGWTSGIHLEGSRLPEAKLIARLANYDLFEIAVADASTRLIRVDNPGADPAAWYARARWFDALRMQDESLEHYIQAYTLDPDDIRSLTGIVRILERKRQDDTVESYLRAAIDHRTTRPLQASDLDSMSYYTGQTLGHPFHLRRQLASLYARMDRHADALAVLDETLAVHPYEWWTGIDRANLLISQGLADRDGVRREMEELYWFHLAGISASESRVRDKEVVEGWYRSALVDWLAMHGFEAEGIP